MPRGRMIDKRISESQKLRLLSDKSRVIYFMLMPHLDKNGSFKAISGLIKWVVLPNIEYNYKIIEKCLRELDREKLIILYEINGCKYLQYINFRRFQTNDISKEGQTDIPLPDTKLLQSYSSVTPDLLPTQDKEEDKGEDKAKNLQPLSDEDFLKNLSDNPAYEHTNVKKELAKMDAWLLTRKGRKKTRKFIVNWLNRIDTPLSPELKEKTYRAT